MKILIIGAYIEDMSKISTFSQVWSYYLRDELEKRPIELVWDPMILGSRLSDEEILEHYSKLNLEGVDHILAMPNRYFSLMPAGTVEILKSKISGKVCQIHETGRLDSDGVDVTFTMCDNSSSFPLDAVNNQHQRHHAYNKHIGWAADPSICWPDQSDVQLGILIDHSAFNSHQVDRTREVYEFVKNLVELGIWRDRFDTVKVRRLMNGRIEDWDMRSLEVERHNRKGVPYKEACANYRKAHIFCVTHTESMGQTIVETACSGALPIIPDGLAPIDRLATIEHHRYLEKPNWEGVLKKVNPIRCSKVASRNNWSIVCDRILSHLK